VHQIAAVKDGNAREVLEAAGDEVEVAPNPTNAGSDRIRGESDCEKFGVRVATRQLPLDCARSQTADEFPLQGKKEHRGRDHGESGPGQKHALIAPEFAQVQIQHHRQRELVLAVEEHIGAKKAFQLPRKQIRQNAAAMGRTSGITRRR